MNALKKGHSKRAAGKQSALEVEVSDMLAGYRRAREGGEDYSVERSQLQAAIIGCVRTGYYLSALNLMSLELEGEPREVAVWCVAKNEVTHEFSVIMLSHSAHVCAPVPLLRFAQLAEHIAFDHAVAPKKLMSDFLPLMTAKTTLGRCRHISSTDQAPREYDVLGSAIHPGCGTPMTLYHETGFRFPEGLRIRRNFGERGFRSNVNRDQLRGPRFQFIEELKPVEALRIAQ